MTGVHGYPAHMILVQHSPLLGAPLAESWSENHSSSLAVGLSCELSMWTMHSVSGGAGCRRGGRSRPTAVAVQQHHSQNYTTALHFDLFSTTESSCSR